MLEHLRGFFVRVGLVTSAIVTSILFLNLIGWNYPELRCVNDMGAIGLATKYPDKVEARVGSPEQPMYTKDLPGNTVMICPIVFGEGWKNVN
jgi:hypothetical protein